MSEFIPQNPLLRRSLDGLSVGDALGECFFNPVEFESIHRLKKGQIPAPPWRWTDDTEMAICLCEVLEEFGHIHQDMLALTFAQRFHTDPYRGYGSMAQRILQSIYDGKSWQDISPAVFHGQGSLGNGSAMRVAPLGAFFAGDTEKIIQNAILSAEVTHYNDEARAGAVAIALAAGFAATLDQVSPVKKCDMINYVLANTPDSITKNKIKFTEDLPFAAPMEEVVQLLGNGSNITCPDTVPLCLWLAMKFLDDYPSAIAATAACEGDIDTNCAIVGGIVSLSTAVPIPQRWLDARGPLTPTVWPKTNPQ